MNPTDLSLGNWLRQSAHAHRKTGSPELAAEFDARAAQADALIDRGRDLLEVAAEKFGGYACGRFSAALSAASANAQKP